jgi:hypothetical protein
MSVNQLLTLITQLTLVLITFWALVDLFRHRDRSRLDIVLMFGDLALIVLLQWIGSSLERPASWLGQLGSILLVAHPFLLLRLVQHLRPVPVGMQIFALAGMVVSWLLIVLFPISMPTLDTILLVGYFVVVELYSALALVRGALITSGVTHWRLLLAALGSGLIGAVILVAGIAAVFKDLPSNLAILSQILGLSSVLSYYLGFTPPAPLRRAWQLS